MSLYFSDMALSGSKLDERKEVEIGLDRLSYSLHARFSRFSTIAINNFWNLFDLTQLGEHLINIIFY